MVNYIYSPILITVYDRLDHLKRSIESLRKCPEARYSTLYIASDAAAKTEHAKTIDEIRHYSKRIDGFRKVVVIERGNNVGAEKNFSSAKEEVFEKYDRLIFLEDDVLVGIGFLRFLNEGLNRFKESKLVVGVCGYLPPGVSFDKGNPVFLRSRSPYGFGIWKWKENSLNEKLNSNYINECFKDPSFFWEYEKNNPQVARSVPLLVRGDALPADIAVTIVMQREKLLALYPPSSITKTVGNDGSGLHAGYDKKLQDQKISNSTYDIPEDFEEHLSIREQKLRSDYYRFFGVRLINYSIFILTQYIPSSYLVYKTMRAVVKAARKKMRKHG